MKAAVLSIGVIVLYVIQIFATSSDTCKPPIIISCDGDKNAEYSKCGDPCPVTCKNMDKPPSCIQWCLKEGGCRCKNGYVRNIRNICIPIKDCPKCGMNEFFDCGSACDTTCATLGQTCPIINITCNEKCYCIPGYARDHKNVCIPIKQCPASKCKGPNEVYASCKEPCPRTCDSITSEKPQPQCAQYPAPCPAGCNCAPGYVRNGSNICVKTEKCPCDDVNAEIVECPNPCPGGTCKMPEFVNCLALCKPYGCQCKQGYVKNKNGKCVLLSKCCEY